jgi:hypothetical protein
VNDEDLRDCFAMLRGITGASPRQCYEFADQMMEARKPKEESGIVAVKRSSTKKEK